MKGRITLGLKSKISQEYDSLGLLLVFCFCLLSLFPSSLQAKAHSLPMGGLKFASCVRDSLTPIEGGKTVTGKSVPGGSTCRGSTAPGLDGPVASAVSPDGLNLYVVSMYSQAVVTFKRQASTGALQYLECVRSPVPNPYSRFSQKPCSGPVVEALGSVPAAIAVSPDGQNVYVASRALSSVARIITFKRDAEGRLTFVGCLASVDPSGKNTEANEEAIRLCGKDNTTPTPLTSGDLKVSPDGQFVYASETTGARDDQGTVIPGAGLNALKTSVSSVILRRKGDGTLEYACTGEGIYTEGNDEKKLEKSRYEENMCGTGWRGYGLTTDIKGQNGYWLGDLGYFHSHLGIFKRNSNNQFAFQGCIEDEVRRNAYPYTPPGCAVSAVGLQSPIDIELSQNGRLAYVASFSDPGSPVVNVSSVAMLQRTPDGNLSGVDCIETFYPGFYERNDEDGNWTGIDISTGCGLPFSMKNRWGYQDLDSMEPGMQSVSSITLSPDGKYLYVTSDANSYGSEALDNYSRVRVDNAVTVFRCNFALGCGNPLPATSPTKDPASSTDDAPTVSLPESIERDDLGRGLKLDLEAESESRTRYRVVVKDAFSNRVVATRDGRSTETKPSRSATSSAKKQRKLSIGVKLPTKRLLTLFKKRSKQRRALKVQVTVSNGRTRTSRPLLVRVK